MHQGNAFVQWPVNLLTFLCLVCGSSLFGDDLSQKPEEDESLILSEDQPEHLVAMTGKLQLRILDSDPESSMENSPLRYWVLKVDLKSFDIACTTPVRASFQTPASIRSFRNGDEIELTGGYDAKWLQSHLDQTVTVEGYLWHAHTAHHHTPVMIDPEPWVH